MDEEKRLAGGAAQERGTVVLATVKGDVHDIGKNIVGVVLACNNYRVVDLGVMVPAGRILAAAAEERAAIVGLSGLITPSLDEMVQVAAEMQRRQLTVPLLIGGATTSRQHTAVKNRPRVRRPRRLCAGRLEGDRRRGELLSDARRPAFEAENRAAQSDIRERHQARSGRPLRPYADALQNRLRIDWSREEIPAPAFTGRRVAADVSLGKLAEYIDWTFFFSAWGLKGASPPSSTTPSTDGRARALRPCPAPAPHARRRGSLRARGVYGLWPAGAEGDDVVLFGDRERRTEIARFPMLRQQEVVEEGRPQISLADFVAPVGGGADYLGAFAVTAGLGADDLAARYAAPTTTTTPSW